jgi:hypothetical protein
LIHLSLLLQRAFAGPLGNEAQGKCAWLEEPILPTAEEFGTFLSSFQACTVSRQWPESLLRLGLFFQSLCSVRLGLRGGAEGWERQEQS